MEAAISIAMTNMAGANLNHDTGYSEYGTTSNLDLVVVADEVLGMARRLTRGIQVDEKTLSLDLIEKIGPGGRYNDDANTRAEEKANYVPRLVNRAARDLWQQAGGKTLTQVANEKVRDIINYHEPAPLPKDVVAKVRSLVENAVGHMPGEEAD